MPRPPHSARRPRASAACHRFVVAPHLLAVPAARHPRALPLQLRRASPTVLRPRRMACAALTGCVLRRSLSVVQLPSVKVSFPSCRAPPRRVAPEAAARCPHRPPPPTHRVRCPSWLRPSMLAFCRPTPVGQDAASRRQYPPGAGCRKPSFRRPCIRKKGVHLADPTSSSFHLVTPPSFPTHHCSSSSSRSSPPPLSSPSSSSAPPQRARPYAIVADRCCDFRGACLGNILGKSR